MEPAQKRNKEKRHFNSRRTSERVNQTFLLHILPILFILSNIHRVEVEPLGPSCPSCSAARCAAGPYWPLQSPHFATAQHRCALQQCQHAARSIPPRHTVTRYRTPACPSIRLPVAPHGVRRVLATRGSAETKCPAGTFGPVLLIPDLPVPVGRRVFAPPMKNTGGNRTNGWACVGTPPASLDADALAFTLPRHRRSA